MNIQHKKLVLFGAGKIGRSFIGQLFSQGGYEVVFIDINKQIIDALNQRKTYRVIIKSHEQKILNINNVRGIHISDAENIIDEISTAGILAVSVGNDNLKDIFPFIAGGLLKRFKMTNNYPLDIIIAENMRDADIYFSKNLRGLLPGYYPFDNLVGLIESSIGKMVPLMTKKDMEDDILQIFAEPYNTLILNRKAFKNPIPSINGLDPKENMKAWVDRKLFIHNLGHSTAAYAGYLSNPGFVFIYEALEIPEIKEYVRETMQEAGRILLVKYPDDFTQKDLDDHIDDLLERFRNKALGDTIFRVGCDLNRKLGPDDRIAGAIRSALELDLPYKKILLSLVCGCHFRARNEEGDMFKGDLEFLRIYEQGIETVLSSVCGFSRTEHGKIFMEVARINEIIKTNTEVPIDFKKIMSGFYGPY